MDHISLLCCSLAFILYCNTLNFGFVYDDRRAILTNPDLLSKTPWTNLLRNDFWGTPLTDSGSHGSYRPLTVLTFRLNYILNGFEPFGYHLVNVFLHCSATYLLIKVANLVLPKPRKRIGTAVSGLLFASHPIHTETVAGVVGRADLIAGNLFFLSLLFYIAHVHHRDVVKNTEQLRHKKLVNKKYDAPEKSVTCCIWHVRNCLTFESEKSGGDIITEGSKHKFAWTYVVKEWMYFGLSVVASAAAMLGKETGVTVLGICFVYDYVFARKSKKQRRSLVMLSISAFLVLSFRLIHASTPIFSTADNPTAKQTNIITRSLTFSYLPVFNFILLLYPQTLSFDWSMDAVPRITTISDKRNILTVFFYLVIVKIFSKCLNRDSTKEYKREKEFLCKLCHIKSIEHHSQRCRVANNNNCQHKSQSCLCKSPRSTINISTDKSILFAISVLIVPFLPATNVAFYVGFVVAERVLYVPSAGMCLLVGLVSARALNHKLFQKYFMVGLVCVLLGFSLRTVMRNKDWADEESLYKSAASVNPPKAYGNLGSVLSSQGRNKEAEEAFRKALSCRPNMADVHYNLGILLQNKHELDEAILSYQRAIHFRPSLALAYVNLGNALIAAGRCQEAVTVLRKGSRLDGSGLRDRREHDSAKISALVQLGSIYAQQGRLQRAVATYREAVSSLPNDYPPQKVYIVLGETLSRLEQDDEAEKWYRAALDADPQHVPAHITYGKLLAKNVSRASEAEQWFRKAQKLAPNDPSVYHHYGGFLALNRRVKEAADMYQKAAELRPDDCELAMAAATAMREANRLNDAEKWYRKAVSLRPSEARYHTNLGAILHLNGKYREAAASYTEALRLQPEDVTTTTNLHKLGGFLALNRRVKEAADMYQKAAELRPDDCELAMAAATAMREANRLNDAEKWYRKAVSLRPSEARYHTNLGAILHLNGKYREAAASYTEALRLQPEDVTTTTNLHKLYGLMT